MTLNRILIFLISFISNNVFCQIEIDLSDVKGNTIKTVPFSNGFISYGSGTSKKSSIVYYNEIGTQLWEKEIIPLNFHNELIIGDEFAYHINFSYVTSKSGNGDESPLQITRIDRDGNQVFSNNKIPNFFKEIGSNIELDNIVSEAVICINDNLYFLFDYLTTSGIGYYMCCIDKDFNSTIKKLNFQASVEDINLRKVGHPKIVGYDKTKIILTQMKNNAGNFSFSITEVDLLDEELSESILIENVKINNELISGYFGFKGGDLSSDPSRIGANGLYTKITVNSTSGLNNLFECKFIDESYYFFGFHNENDRINGVWMFSMNSKDSEGSTYVIKLENEEKLSSIGGDLNLFKVSDKIYLSIVKSDGLYIADIEKNKIKKASIQEILSEFSSMHNLLTYPEKKSGYKYVYVQNGVIYLFNEIPNMVTVLKY